MAGWKIYAGDGTPHDDIERIPEAPAWRQFDGGPPLEAPRGDCGDVHAATTYQASADTVELVNAALFLRRPLFVTGRPGTGKSTLAYAIAHELRLGPVLSWPITSRSTLRNALYQYDPLMRLADTTDQSKDRDDVGQYVRLGPLGTALLPYTRPRVLLIDEIDKSDIDLPNDLLNVMEKGEYEVDELVRVAHQQAEAEVMIAGDIARVMVANGRVRCRAFPLIVMTSNDEREFPPAFLRRCISLRLPTPSPSHLAKVVRAHLGPLADGCDDIVERFVAQRSRGELATDQLLNAIYLLHHATRHEALDRAALADRVMPFLSSLVDNVDEPD